MKLDEVLGRREGQRLEFKAGAALGEPGNIARAVVGMLNADGGEIWIGVDEKDGVATGLTPIANPGRAMEQLWNHLLDAVDPTPTPEEISIEVEPQGADPALLVVRVRPQGPETGRLPYAFRRKGGWYFLRRVGARNHPMSRQEIFGKAVAEGSDPAVDDAVQKLLDDRTAFRDSGQSGLWLALQPALRLELDLQAPQFEEIILDPSITGNRQAGWHFARSNNPLELKKDRIEWGLWSDILNRCISQAKVIEDGGLRFRTSLERLHWKGDEHELWPLTLLEYPISAFRIARVIYQGHLGPDDPVAADLALFGVGGWKLRAGTPGDFFLDPDSLRSQDEPDLIWEPVVFTFGEIDATPDRCGFRLVRRVYQAFGLRETDMPRQYDPQTGRLVLPE